MPIHQPLIFGPYRFDLHTGQVWRGTQEVRLTGKAAAVLCHLVARAGQVVTKEALFQAVWPETVVSDAALTSCIQELRQALHENARKPRYIETMHRRGFRFLGKVVSSQQKEANQKAKGKNQKAKVEDFSPVPSPQRPAPTLVGRAPDLAFLHAQLAKALDGERQLVFVTGELGIGKTTLLAAFVAEVQDQEESQKAKGKRQKF